MRTQRTREMGKQNVNMYVCAVYQHAHKSFSTRASYKSHITGSKSKTTGASRCGMASSLFSTV